MKLTTLKPRLAATNLQRLKPTTTNATGIERKRGSAGVKDRAQIKARDCGLCQGCRAAGKVRGGYIVDHVTPLWAAGSDKDDNKQLLCHVCHDAKTAHEAGQRAAGALTHPYVFPRY